MTDRLDKKKLPLSADRRLRSLLLFYFGAASIIRSNFFLQISLFQFRKIWKIPENFHIFPYSVKLLYTSA